MYCIISEYHVYRKKQYCSGVLITIGRNHCFIAQDIEPKTCESQKFGWLERNKVDNSWFPFLGVYSLPGL